MSNQRWVQEEAVLARASGDSLLIMPLQTRVVSVLGGAAPTVWLRLRQPSGMEEVTARVADDYGVPPATVSEHVGTTLHLLLGLGAVRCAER